MKKKHAKNKLETVNHFWLTFSTVAEFYTALYTTWYMSA